MSAETRRRRQEALRWFSQRAVADTRPGCVTSAQVTSTPTADRDAGGGGGVARPRRVATGPAQPHERAPRRSLGRESLVSKLVKRELEKHPAWSLLSPAHRDLLKTAVDEWMDVRGFWCTSREKWWKKAGYSEDTMDRALAAYRDHGLLTSERHFRPPRRPGQPGSGDQSSNNYYLAPSVIVPVLEKLEREADEKERPDLPEPPSEVGNPTDSEPPMREAGHGSRILREADTVPASCGTRKLGFEVSSTVSLSTSIDKFPAADAAAGDEGEDQRGSEEPSRDAVESVGIEEQTCRGCSSWTTFGFPDDGYCERCSARLRRTAP